MLKREGIRMKKKALAIISFGTTYPTARKAINKLENYLAEQFEDYDFYRAFTSQMVVRKILREEGIEIDTPEVLMNKLVQKGYEEVLCQSLHIINGFEYDKMKAQIEAKKEFFKSIWLGQPLLNTNSDYERCVKAMMQNVPSLKKDEALVFMGHGTEHFANASYCQLESMFYFMGYEDVYVGTVEGFPNIDYILARLAQRHIRKVYVSPFMIVAGDHAKVDLIGDAPDSWKSLLEVKGYEVEGIIKGIGEYKEIGEIFLQHLKEAETNYK